MSGWTLTDTSTQGCSFRRPLDAIETGFFWDGLFNGTADNLQHFELRLSNVAQDARLFSEANIVKAWLSTKRRYPLAGAIVEGVSGVPPRAATMELKTSSGGGGDNGIEFASKLHFIVREHNLITLRPREVVFGSIAGAEDMPQQVATIWNGPRPLSEELLTQLYVFRETDSNRTDVLHLVILMAHCITDGVANRTFARSLLDTLARGRETELAQVPLEDRLAMAVSSMDLEPAHLRSLSPAVRRWRRAAAAVIFQLMRARRQGGHTLPCRLTLSTPHVAARPGVVFALLTPTLTAAVIANCRLHNLTFGTAYPVLAQVAMTRVLYRRYLRGEVSEEEWTYRKRQPYVSGGPLNLRRYLDKGWFNRGGGGEFMLSISIYFYQLPFMTLGATAEQHSQVLSNGAPPFSDLLTFDRFVYRVRLVKKQGAAFFGHPLFSEIIRAMHLGHGHQSRLRALQWMTRVKTANDHNTHASGDEDEDKVLAVTDIPTVWAHGGSSLGNVDLMTPTEYPLSPTHPLSPYSSIPHPVKAGYVTPSSSSPSEDDTTPKIVVENSRVQLHTRPAELYLGAATSCGQMKLYVHYDGNVFEEAVVKEWLDEVRDAVLWYLGRVPE